MSASTTVLTSIATYYVLPIYPPKGPVPSGRGEDPGSCEKRVQDCAYYSFLPPSSWTQLRKAELVAEAGANYVCLIQLMNQDGLPKKQDWEQDVTLFAGVARTLEKDDPAGPLANVFVANRTNTNEHAGPTGPTLIIPVDPGTTRGLILIFTKAAQNGKPDHIRATYDPEIKGSTN